MAIFRPAGIARDWLQDGWAYVRTVARVLRPARFSVIVFALGSVALFVDQGQEVLLAIGDPAGGGFWSKVLFFVAVTIWALNCWYGARVMLHIDFTPRGKRSDPYAIDRNDKHIKRLLKHAPRIIGAGCYAAVAATLGLAQGDFTYLVFASLVLGVLFLLFAIFRRTVLGRWMKDTSGEVRQADALIGNFMDLPVATLAAVCITFALALITFLVSIFLPAWPMDLGIDPAVILLFAIATWVPAGSYLVYTARKNQLPVLTIVFAFAVLFSFWNDNHTIRTCGENAEECVEDGSVAASVKLRPPVAEAYKAWNSRLPEQAGNPAGTRPLVVIATAGGGSRAAYWTATVLGEIHKQRPNFADHVFAISGVSGGSLGAVVYRALLNPGTPDADIGAKAQTILGCKAPVLCTTSR